MQTALFIFIKRKWSSDQAILSKFINYYSLIKEKAQVSMRFSLSLFLSVLFHL